MMEKKILALLFLSCAMVAPAQTRPAKAVPAKVADFGWMAGCWERNDTVKKLRIVEQWMSPDGDAMLGMSRTVRDGKMTGYEFLRIVTDAVSVKYVSRPAENATDTAFRVVEWTANSVVFSNPDHDFPQRIIYRREGNKLNARIEGKSNGKMRGIDFPYVRVKCD